MPITIGSNIYSLNAQRRLADGSNQLSKVFERLSSGQRINRASDDAAGLAISSSLNADVRVFNQGVRNINDGSSLLNIADGAIEQLSSITVRLKELAEQAANGTYGYHQRKSLDAEAQALSKEYLRIIQSTTFNGRKLFDANFGEIRLQAGYGLDGGIQSGLGGSIGTGSFGSLETYQAESTTSTQIALGDINGNGIIDMITSGTGGGQFATVRLGNGDGTFGGSTSYQMLNAHLSLADLNGDGILDMVSAGNGINVRFGNGDGTFGDVTTYSTSSVGGLEVGDLNGDGVQDIIFSTFDGYNSYVNIMYGSGDGSFSAQSSYLVQTSSSASDIRIGDFNGDGVVDVITVNFCI